MIAIVKQQRLVFTKAIPIRVNAAPLQTTHAKPQSLAETNNKPLANLSALSKAGASRSPHCPHTKQLTQQTRARGLALPRQLMVSHHPPMCAPAAISLHDLTFSALEERMEGLRPVHALTLWKAMHRQQEQPLLERTDFLPPLRRWVAEHCGPSGALRLDAPEISTTIHSSDGLTKKFLLRLSDGQTIETVLMGYPGRFTACVSTQVGCAMGCVFCATGQLGFTRHLRTGEIVSQVLLAERDLRSRGEAGLRNLVLMGMGEPLHNYDAVMDALEIISDRRGINLTPRRMTISTVGVVPGIIRLAEEQRPYNLAVSLHAATQEERAALVPTAKRWTLDQLIGACRFYDRKIGRKIFFEWTLIEGANDSVDQAEVLCQLLGGINAHVNLIPLNPTCGYDGQATGSAAAKRFQEVLKEAGIPSTVRQRRGIDVAAGCGQLRAAQ